MGELEATLQYRLSVDLDGDTYQSEYLSPIFSAGIDSIFPMKEGRGTPVCIYLSSHAAENSSKYYRWKYRETWEVKAELYANARWAPEGGGSVIFHSFHTSENTYFCWGRDSSKALIIGDTEKLSQNVVARQKLLEIPCDHDKLSILYHIEAEQMQVREAAYRYFADLQEKVERTGDLFSPILGTGLRGNIYSLNNPEQMVAGYVDVSTTTRKDAYVWERGEDFYEPPRIRCYTGPAKFGYGSIYIYDESSAPERCVDCRTKENASKDKPAGWPTEHL
jgi:hypothetical protein